MEHALLTLPEHLSSPPVFNAVRVSLSLIFCVFFADRCLSFCPFSFVYCIVCASSIYLRLPITPLVYSTFSFSAHAHLYGYGGSPRIQGSIIDIRIDKTSYKYQLQNRPEVAVGFHLRCPLIK